VEHQRISEIMIRTHGGLGNQLYQVFYVLLLKNLYEAKVLLWHDENYYHKFKLAGCFDYLKSSKGMPLILRIRLIKLFKKIGILGNLERLRFGVVVYLDGYFQDIETYNDFTRTEKEKVLNILRHQLNINSFWKDEPLVHLRLGDFFQDDKSKIAKLDSMLQRASEIGHFHCITNEEDLVKKRLKYLKLDAEIAQTANMTAVEVLRLMASYKHIISNGSTLATWAAILGGSKLTSTVKQVQFITLLKE